MVLSVSIFRCYLFIFIIFFPKDLKALDSMWELLIAWELGVAVMIGRERQAKWTSLVLFIPLNLVRAAYNGLQEIKLCSPDYVGKSCVLGRQAGLAHLQPIICWSQLWAWGRSCNSVCRILLQEFPGAETIATSLPPYSHWLFSTEEKLFSDRTFSAPLRCLCTVIGKFVDVDLLLYQNSVLRKYCMRKCGDHSTHLESLRWLLSSRKVQIKKKKTLDSPSCHYLALI